MLSRWEQKERQGAARMACMACGAHALITARPDAGPTACNCCGSLDLRAVATTERRRRAARAIGRGANGCPSLVVIGDVR